MFTSATIHINRDYYPGTRFVLKAPASSDSARYIRSATLNGAQLRRASLSHATITAGGVLSLVMDSVPSTWGD